MNEKPINLLYLLGAGRSGTTMLTTVLNNHPQIYAVGEMHQFLDYVTENKDCSCGSNVSACEFWGPVIDKLDHTLLEEPNTVSFSNNLECHKYIPKHYLKATPNKRYSALVNMIFNAISQEVDEPWLLDSSKYISRFLLLRKNKRFNVKGIYMVRDVRGVVHSFGKKVQTQKGPLSAILYYTLINFWGQLVTTFDRNIIQIRYEDFVNNPDEVLKKLEGHVFQENSETTRLDQKTFKIPHIIAGNRLRSQKQLVIKKDLAWKKNISRGKQILYYFLAFPTMFVNRYKV